MVQLSTIAAGAVLGLAARVAAAPAPSPDVTSCQTFQLQTELIPNQPASKYSFGGLYFQSYHTGAGENDVVLSTSEGTYLHLNNSQLQGSLGTSGPYNTLLPIDNNYAAWSSVQFNVGGYGPIADSFFSFNSNNQLVYSDTQTGSSEGNAWNGWLACDWWHGVPQLFWTLEGYDNTVIPDSCQQVALNRVCPST